MINKKLFAISKKYLLCAVFLYFGYKYKLDKHNKKMLRVTFGVYQMQKKMTIASATSFSAHKNLFKFLT
ncbi:MAG: hypothetical protein EAZ57_01940 [Cytophagales bacterium]|nr:MAG: hypothetical protein EAZ67_02650 [Cytophagales bacterium]TAF61885.1 MAG: hypothetical protein EAZ57_01940 [Cytophagales bacterium]